MSTTSAISSTTATTTTTTTSTNNTLGQEQFLTLLVAQLQNQDPLNPADATEFTSQLAQYSQLEQLFNLNESMDQLAEAQNNSERLSALSMIGKEILVENNTFNYSGEDTEIGYIVDGTASDITLQIRNSTGQTVRTLTAEETSEGTHYLTWDGLNASGEEVDEGSYTIVVSGTSASEDSSVTITPLVHTEVTGVDLSGTEAQIVTNYGSYGISSIHGVYDEGQTSTTTSSTVASAAAAATEEIVSDATDGSGDS